MARQTVNIGTSANKGNGDPLRTAFTKINNNLRPPKSIGYKPVSFDQNISH